MLFNGNTELTTSRAGERYYILRPEVTTVLVCTNGIICKLMLAVSVITL